MDFWSQFLCAFMAVAEVGSSRGVCLSFALSICKFAGGTNPAGVFGGESYGEYHRQQAN